MRERVATVLQAAGVTAGTVSGFTVSDTAGFAVLAVGLLLFGLAVERG